MDSLSASSEQDALELLHQLGCTDGLPVVIPTADRVARMVLATGHEPDLVLGVRQTKTLLQKLEVLKKKKQN